MFKDLFKLAIILLVLDIVFISFVIKPFFLPIISGIQGKPIVLDKLSVGLCYVLVVIGIYYFIIREKKTPKQAFLLGFIIYAVYETTSKALFSNWNYKMVIIDSLWGGILFYLTTTIYYKLVSNGF